MESISTSGDIRVYDCVSSYTICTNTDSLQYTCQNMKFSAGLDVFVFENESLDVYPYVCGWYFLSIVR